MIRCRFPATSSSVAAQPAQGTVQCGLWNVAERPTTRRQILKAAAHPMRASPERAVRYGPPNASRPDRGFRLANRKKYDEFDYGYVLTVHKAKDRMGRRRAVRRVVRVSRQSRALALHRHHAGGEAVDDCRVATSVSARMATASPPPRGRRMIRARCALANRGCRRGRGGRQCGRLLAHAGEFLTGHRLDIFDFVLAAAPTGRAHLVAMVRHASARPPTTGSRHRRPSPNPCWRACCL